MVSDSGIAKGKIVSTEYFHVACGICGREKDLFAETRKGAGAEARDDGWKLTREWGWICGDHQRDIENNLLTA